MCMKPYKNKGTCIYTHTSTNRFIRSVCVWDLAFWFVWIFNVFSQVSSWWHIQLLMSSKPRWWALTWPSGAAECVTAVKTWASVSVGRREDNKRGLTLRMWADVRHLFSCGRLLWFLVSILPHVSDQWGIWRVSLSPPAGDVLWWHLASYYIRHEEQHEREIPHSCKYSITIQYSFK